MNNSATIGNSKVTESALNLSDVTTADVSTSKHGFVPKAPNDITQILKGEGSWETLTVKEKKL